MKWIDQRHVINFLTIVNIFQFFSLFKMNVYNVWERFLTFFKIIGNIVQKLGGNNLNKLEVLNHVKKMEFTKDVYSILELIEQNLHRVEFVKDHMGLNNFVFLAEKEATKFEFPYFACFNLDIHENDEAHNFVSMNQSLIYDLKEIQKDMKNFFLEEEGVLYVEIGFKESVPNQEDRFRVYQLLKKKEVNDIQEAIAKVRKFPEWYKAKFSREVLDEKVLFEQLELAEAQLLKQLKNDLVQQINEALLKNDEQLFMILTKRYKKVCKETQ